MLVRSEIAGQKQILWIFGYKKGKNGLILSLGLARIIPAKVTKTLCAGDCKPSTIFKSFAQ